MQLDFGKHRRRRPNQAGAGEMSYGSRSKERENKAVSSEKETTSKAASIAEVGGFDTVINRSSRVGTQWKHGSQKRRKTWCTATAAVIVI